MEPADSNNNTWRLTMQWTHPLMTAHRLEDTYFLQRVANTLRSILDEQAHMDALESQLVGQEEFPQAEAAIMSAYHKYQDNR